MGRKDFKHTIQPDEDGVYRCHFPSCNCNKEFDSPYKVSAHLGGRQKVVGAYGVITRHGTRNSYEAEVRQGKVACQACRDANSAYQRDYRARQRLIEMEQSRGRIWT